MIFSVLASGSRGNCTLVETTDRCILVDIGLGPRVLAGQLSRLGRTVEQITDVLLTHRHSDHISGLEHFCRRNEQARLHATPGTWRGLPEEARARCTKIHPRGFFTLGATEVFAFPLSHDAAQTVGFRITNADATLGMVTDLGLFDESITDALSGITALVVEANHDRRMLAFGPYPAYLKTRIAGPKGHLSNDQCADLVGALCRQQPPLDVTLAHVSETNNSPAHLQRLATNLVDMGVGTVRIAARRSTDGFVDMMQHKSNLGKERYSKEGES